MAGDAGRGSRGPLADPRRFELGRLLEADGELLGRWVRAAVSAAQWRLGSVRLERALISRSKSLRSSKPR